MIQTVPAEMFDIQMDLLKRQLARLQGSNNATDRSGEEFVESSTSDSEEYFSDSGTSGAKDAGDNKSSRDESVDGPRAIYGPYAEFVSGETRFRLFRAILPSNGHGDVMAEIRGLPEAAPWAFFLLRGGHFAGAIFEKGEVTRHKCFHRYVMRCLIPLTWQLLSEIVYLGVCWYIESLYCFSQDWFIEGLNRAQYSQHTTEKAEQSSQSQLAPVFDEQTRPL